MLARAEEVVLSSKDVNYPLQEIQMTVEDEVIKNLTVKLAGNLNALESFLQAKPGKPYSYYFAEPEDIDVIAKVLLGLMSTRKAYDGIKDGDCGYIRCGSDASGYQSIQILIALSLSKSPVNYVKDSFCQEIKKRLGKVAKKQETKNDLYEEIFGKKSQPDQQCITAKSSAVSDDCKKEIMPSVIGSSPAFFSHEAPTNPDMVKLKNGTEVYAKSVSGIMMNLESLMEDRIAFKDFVNKCRNPKYIMVTTLAEELSLIQNDVIHDITRNVVLSAVREDGLDMTLESPLAEDRLTFGRF